MKTSYPRVKQKQRCENCRHFSLDAEPIKYAGAPSSNGWCNLPLRESKRRRATDTNWCKEWRKKDE